jgi:hypothetical protein
MKARRDALLGRLAILSETENREQTNKSPQAPIDRSRGMINERRATTNIPYGCRA